MADDDRDDTREGWYVPTRIGMIAIVATPIALAILVLIAGLVYNRTLRPKLLFSVTPQPAPGLKADVHAGVADPEIAPPLAPPDAAIERAKAATARQGLPGWAAGNAQ